MLLESIIKKELKKLYEAKEAKGGLAKELDEFSTIHEQITKLKSQLKSLESDPKYKEGKEKIGAIMEELKAKLEWEKQYSKMLEELIAHYQREINYLKANT